MKYTAALDRIATVLAVKRLDFCATLRGVDRPSCIAYATQVNGLWGLDLAMPSGQMPQTKYSVNCHHGVTAPAVQLELYSTLLLYRSRSRPSP